MYDLVVNSPPVPQREEPWRRLGRCRDMAGTMTSLFFSEDAFKIARAKAICSVCPVASECYETAAASHEPWGVWGGQWFENGHPGEPTRRGRPRLRPLPTIADEVPLPPDLAPA